MICRRMLKKDKDNMGTKVNESQKYKDNMGTNVKER